MSECSQFYSNLLHFIVLFFVKVRRTLRNGLTEEEQHHIQQLIQGY